MLINEKPCLSQFSSPSKFWCIALILAFAWFWQQPAKAQPDERLQVALDSAVPEESFEVGIGVQVEQVVSINQKSENFEVVGNLRLQWDDPKLAFDPGADRRSFRIFGNFTNGWSNCCRIILIVQAQSHPGIDCFNRTTLSAIPANASSK